MYIELAEINRALNHTYSLLFYGITFVLSIATVFYLSFNDNNRLRISSGIVPGALLCFCIILYFGLATLFGVYLGDAVLYEWGYRHIDQTTQYVSIFETEALFTNLQIFIYRLGLHDYIYFATLISFIYMATIFIASYMVMRDYLWIALIFFITSFSFFGYGVNGIRNGAACHLAILGIIFFIEEKKLSQIFALILFAMAFSIHKSTILPILIVIFLRYISVGQKTIISIWIVSIFLSLFVGNYFGVLFSNLGLDDRMSAYLQGQDISVTMQQDLFGIGFRWDFLLYSAIPIVFTWYLTIKRNFRDKAFNIISGTYILANAFWIIVIRASFSNRFAYLSWFLYPLVIAYPLLRMNIWENQSHKTALILLAYSGFTFYMFFIYNS